MKADFTSGDHVTEVNPGDPLYRDLQLRGYNRRIVGTPDSVFVVADADQVVNAIDAVVASGQKLAVRSGGHCNRWLRRRSVLLVVLGEAERLAQSPFRLSGLSTASRSRSPLSLVQPIASSSCVIAAVARAASRSSKGSKRAMRPS